MPKLSMEDKSLEKQISFDNRDDGEENKTKQKEEHKLLQQSPRSFQKKKQRPRSSSSLSISLSSSEVGESGFHHHQVPEFPLSSSNKYEHYDNNTVSMPSAKHLKRRREGEIEKKKKKSNVVNSCSTKSPSSQAKRVKKSKEIASAEEKNNNTISSSSSGTKSEEKKSKAIASSEPKQVEVAKKILFQRVWTLEDEVSILKGLIDYSKTKEISRPALIPSTDMTGFYNFVNNSFGKKFTRIQVADKLRGLKKKFQNRNKKSTVNLGPQASLCFELSKSIWGEEVATATAEAAKIKEEACLADGNFEEGFGSLMEFVLNKTDLDKQILMKSLKSLEGPSKAATQENWKRYQAAQVEYYQAQNQVMQDVLKLYRQQ